MSDTASAEHLRSVPSRRLRAELTNIMEGVAKGEHMLITHRSEPVAVLMPIDKKKFHEFLLSQAPDYVQTPKPGE